MTPYVCKKRNFLQWERIRPAKRSDRLFTIEERDYYGMIYAKTQVDRNDLDVLLNKLNQKPLTIGVGRVQVKIESNPQQKKSHKRKLEFEPIVRLGAFVKI
jgi:hypothetical protein